MQKRFIAFSGFSGALAVCLGAMGAHFLKSKVEAGTLTQLQLNSFETGVRYHIYHSIALLVLGLLYEKMNHHFIHKAGYCFMIGTVLFSGSIYFLSTAPLLGLGELKWLGPVTPIGGVFMITGWILVGLAAYKHK